MPGVTLLAASRPRETRPVGGPAGQQAFLNGAFLVETAFTPDDVLATYRHGRPLYLSPAFEI